LDIGILGFTKGYETYVFDSGTFTRAGECGFINWSFAGNFVQNDNVVVFSPVPGTTKSPLSFSNFCESTNSIHQSKHRRPSPKKQPFHQQPQSAPPTPTMETTLSTASAPMAQHRAVLLTTPTSTPAATSTNSPTTTSMSLTVPTTFGSRPGRVSKIRRTI
jgi:hypothetical protein